MKKTATATLLTVLAVAAGVVACEDPTGEEDREFSATLSAEGDVTSSATGTATFELEDGVMGFTISTSNITAVTGAHIHGPAGANQNAGVLVPLFAGPDGGTGTVNGQLVAGTFTAADIQVAAVSMDSLLVLMANGQSYVNVHTAANPGGEIRGQITED